MNSPENPPPTRSARRFRLQFGLRTLFVVVLLVSLALGRYVQNVRAQREAVAALEAAGAKVNYDSGDFAKGIENPRDFRERIEWATPKSIRDSLGIDFFRSVRSIYFSNVNNADFPSALGNLRDLPQLQRFGAFCALDEDLDYIVGLDELTELGLSHSVISDASLARLEQLKSLEHLHLHAWDEEDPGVVWRGPITDAGLAKLANLRRLSRLGVSGSAVSGAGLRHLVGMSELEWLDLSRTMVADEGLESLRSLPKLRLLDLSKTAITDKGLHVLGDLASLAFLEINGTLATAEGVERLKRRLPNADIQWYEDEDENENEDEYGNAELGRAEVLMRAGLWRRAIEALKAANASRLYANDLMFRLGWCYAELRQWDEASHEFCKALEEIDRRRSASLPMAYGRDRVWQHINRWPQVFERVVRARPNDEERWFTSARRAVVSSRWASAAADYVRAMECAAAPDATPEFVFEYGQSRLLAGDLREHRRVCERLLKNAERAYARLPENAVSRNPYSAYFALHCRALAMQLLYTAPAGSSDAPGIAGWPANRQLALPYYRTGQFEKVLEQQRPSQEGGGVYWFCCAMACQKLGRAAQAQECYAQGVHWLERRMKYDRLCGIQYNAGDFLQTEALRREAKRLIFE